MTVLGYNVAYEMVQAHSKVQDARQIEKDAIVQKLEEHHVQLKDLSAVITELTNKKSTGKASFNDSPELIALLDRVREANRDSHTKHSIIPDNTYSWNSEKEIENILTVLNDHVKIIAGEINTETMRMQEEYKVTLEITDISQKTLDMLIRFIESILNKMRAG